jgi:hypothetical protein
MCECLREIVCVKGCVFEMERLCVKENVSECV